MTTKPAPKDSDEDRIEKDRIEKDRIEKDRLAKDRLEGEGSYSGTRAYNKATKEFIDSGKVDKAAQDASRALESGDGAELAAAEARGKAGDPKGLDRKRPR